jgi:iron(III) transport system ATP-binding protein
MNPPAVELQQLTVRHPGATAPALDGVSLVLAPGELVALLGPSGCGKSTLLRVVAGLEPRAGGCVRVGGQDMAGRNAAERPVCLVFQQYALFPHLTVLDNVAFGLRAAGVGEASALQRATAALELVGLPGLGARSPATLSGGQQQRVALARALVVEPAVLLLDEPLANLDHALRRQLREDIRALQQRLRLAALYVTHDHAEALAVADRVAVLQQGRIEQLGTPRALYEQPASAFVAGFLGEAMLADVRVDADGRAWLGPLALPQRPPAGGAWCVAVRPHAWRIERAGTAGLPARVRRSAYLGSTVEYRLDSELGEILAVSPRTGRRHDDGAPVSLQLPGPGVALLRA